MGPNLTSADDRIGFFLNVLVRLGLTIKFDEDIFWLDKFLNFCAEHHWDLAISDSIPKQLTTNVNQGPW